MQNGTTIAQSLVHISEGAPGPQPKTLLIPILPAILALPFGFSEPEVAYENNCRRRSSHLVLHFRRQELNLDSLS